MSHVSPTKEKRSRRFTLTFFYEAAGQTFQDVLQTLRELFMQQKVLYYVAGNEYSLTGRPHAEIYVILSEVLLENDCSDSQKANDYFRRLFPGSYINIPKNDDEFCSDYAKKLGNFEENGTLPGTTNYPPITNHVSATESPTEKRSSPEELLAAYRSLPVAPIRWKNGTMCSCNGRSPHSHLVRIDGPSTEQDDQENQRP